MSDFPISRRGALRLALGAAAGLAGASAGARRAGARLFHRAGLAFGTTVAITLEAADARAAEAGFAAAFREIRAIDRLASLTRPDGDLFRLNRDGFLDRPDPRLIEMLRMAQAMHEASSGAFDVTIQPLWLALDAAAKRGVWPSEREIRALCERVDQNRLVVADEKISFGEPGMGITLNSIARGYAADRVAAALAREGFANALFDVDVLGAMGRRPDDAAWRASIRDPRRPGGSVGVAEFQGCLSTSGDYQYFWSPDYARNHVVDPRHGVSPLDFSSVTVLARTGLAADALSTAAFLIGRASARRLVERFGAEALFVDKHGAVSRTPGFPELLETEEDA